MKKSLLIAVLFNASLCYVVSAAPTSTDDAKNDASFDETDDSLQFHLPDNLLGENQDASDEFEVSGNDELAKKYGLPDTLDVDTPSTRSSSLMSTARENIVLPDTLDSPRAVSNKDASFSDIVLPESLDSPLAAKPPRNARPFDNRRAQGQRPDNRVGPAVYQHTRLQGIQTNARAQSRPLNERNSANARFPSAYPANVNPTTLQVPQVQQDSRQNTQQSFTQNLPLAPSPPSSASVDPVLHMAQGAQAYYQQAGYIQAMQMHQAQLIQAHVHALEQQRQEKLAMARQYYRDAMNQKREVMNQNQGSFGDSHFQISPSDTDRAKFALRNQPPPPPPLSRPPFPYGARDFQAPPSSSSSSSASVSGRRPPYPPPPPPRSQAQLQPIPYASNHNRLVNRPYAPAVSTTPNRGQSSSSMDHSVSFPRYPFSSEPFSEESF